MIRNGTTRRPVVANGAPRTSPGYCGCVTVEITKMVQRRAGDMPRDAAARSFRTLAEAAARAGGPLASGVT